ncbi:MAG TPA: glycosyl hydrolase family 28-related protein, partial [Opitutus sp.]|nr:glycosyl hydrolase family 28-related protein [Opitutus sp.]
MNSPHQVCHSVADFGAASDGVTLAHDAFNHAIAACHQGGGGTVLVPAGVYLVGTIELLSNVTLHLEAGAVIKGSPHLADYRVLPYTSEFRNTTLLLADGATNIAITGRGTIDGNGAAFGIFDEADLSRDFDAKHTRQGEAYYAINDLPDDGPVKHKPRPGILILLVRCRDVVVRDIKLVDAPNWCLHVACSV